jgi:hypothetical protein
MKGAAATGASHFLKTLPMLLDNGAVSQNRGWTPQVINARKAALKRTRADVPPPGWPGSSAQGQAQERGRHDGGTIAPPSLLVCCKHVARMFPACS